MAKVRFRFRFYVMIALLVVVLGVAIFLIVAGSKEGEIQSGAIRLSYDTKSVIIRDEQTFTTESYEKVLFDVIEGAQVEQGQQIAQVFRWGYQEETMQTLLDVQKEILTQQLASLDGIIRQDLEETTSAITLKEQEIRAAARGDNAKDMLGLELELKELLNRRSEILKDIQANETLTELYSREQQQVDNINTWKRNITNDAGMGVISFYFDGYEGALSATKLDLLTSDLVSGVLRGSGATSTVQTESENPLYRLMDDQHFFIAFLTDKSTAFRVVAGEEYTVIFAGYADRPYTGTAYGSFVSGNQVVNILEFRQQMGDLTGVRVVEANILKDASGLQVPLDAIAYDEEGMPGIERKSGDTTTFIEIDVLSADAEQAIIRAKNGTDLVAGQQYVKP
ncbi:hypothetical protein LJC27_00275 [Christensenellaceae bacterium OttesenSCG-928-M15]|nr:hypothetical protein [Christensenellaceae bacterium OttesenSCG-928-M15]